MGVCDVQAPQLVHNALVGDFVTALIGSDGAADLAQHWVTVLNRVPCSGTVADLGGTLLQQTQISSSILILSIPSCRWGFSTMGAGDKLWKDRGA